MCNSFHELSSAFHSHINMDRMGGIRWWECTIEWPNSTDCSDELRLNFFTLYLSRFRVLTKRSPWHWCDRSMCRGALMGRSLYQLISPTYFPLSSSSSPIPIWIYCFTFRFEYNVGYFVFAFIRQKHENHKCIRITESLFSIFIGFVDFLLCCVNWNGAVKLGTAKTKAKKDAEETSIMFGSCFFYS